MALMSAACICSGELDHLSVSSSITMRTTASRRVLRQGTHAAGSMLRSERFTSLATLTAQGADMGGDVYRRFRAAAVQAAPVDRHPFYRRLHDNAIEVPSPQVDRLGDIARRRRVVLSV